MDDILIRWEHERELQAALFFLRPDVQQVNASHETFDRIDKQPR